MIVEGLSEHDISKFGVLNTDEGRLCYAAALENPKYWSQIGLEVEAGWCCSGLPQGLREYLGLT
jgi:hypothetical protein